MICKITSRYSRPCNDARGWSANDHTKRLMPLTGTTRSLVEQTDSRRGYRATGTVRGFGSHRPGTGADGAAGEQHPAASRRGPHRCSEHHPEDQRNSWIDGRHQSATFNDWNDGDNGDETSRDGRPSGEIVGIETGGQPCLSLMHPLRYPLALRVPTLDASCSLVWRTWI